MFLSRFAPTLFSTGVRTQKSLLGSPGVALIHRVKQNTLNEITGKAFVRNFQTAQLLRNKLPPKPDFATSAREKIKLSKSKLLAQASGPISRLLIHIKWPLKRNNKPFSIDDVSALFSWLVMGNLLWVVLGTTTFGLVLLYSLHTFDSALNRIQEYFHKNDDESGSQTKRKDESLVGYLTSSILSYGLGLKLEFEKRNVLPHFKDGKLFFNNIRIISDDKENTDITFRCDVKSLSLSLSFGKWSDGNGLIQDLEISGANAKIYKTSKPNTPVTNMDSVVDLKRYHDSIHFQFDMNDQTDQVVQPKKTSRIDPNYELSLVNIHDSYFEVYDSRSPERPLKITIFNCELPKVTGKTMLIDFFNADNVTGLINNSMFTIHKKQDYNSSANQNMIRFKLDGIDLAGLAQTSPQSKFNWIMNGKAEIIADIRFPSAQYEENSLFEQEYRKISDIVNKIIYDIGSINTQKHETHENSSGDETKLMKGALQAIYQTFHMDKENQETENENEQYVFIDSKIKFYNLHATMPKELPTASTGNVPFLTLHDLRSLVSYINKLDTDNRPPIITKSMAIEKISDLYNVEHLTETRIFNMIVSEVYDDLLRMVKLHEKQIINEKSSLWSHSIASQLLLLGLGVIV